MQAFAWEFQHVQPGLAVILARVLNRHAVSQSSCATSSNGSRAPRCCSVFGRIDVGRILRLDTIQLHIKEHTWEDPMYRYLLAIASLTTLLLVPFTRANAQVFLTKFSGFNEIGGLGAGETGAILSEGQGTLTVNLDDTAKQLTYTLTYSGLSAPVTQAHIHFGKNHVAGGIIVFLCTNLGNG